jgi:hypothetical protein
VRELERDLRPLPAADLIPQRDRRPHPERAPRRRSWTLHREIARALFVTLNTVDSHIRHIVRKLSITNRAEIAAQLDEP